MDRAQHAGRQPGHDGQAIAQRLHVRTELSELGRGVDGTELPVVAERPDHARLDLDGQGLACPAVYRKPRSGQADDRRTGGRGRPLAVGVGRGEVVEELGYGQEARLPGVLGAVDRVRDVDERVQLEVEAVQDVAVRVGAEAGTGERESVDVSGSVDLVEVPCGVR
ncbi:hypothetical protein [Streptomyces iakyrus]|uniref:hypothetical protein n=1 Tax=Streptomyces iakyrus TaxID=68219 RepID=UPI0034069235